MLVAAWASSAVGATSVADAALVPAPESRSRTKGPKEVVCSKRPKLLIISAGDIGTTTAISEFHKIPELEANCPSDSDGLKGVVSSDFAVEVGHCALRALPWHLGERPE